MRGGLLREILVFKEPKTMTGKSGFAKIEYVPFLTCRAYRKKLSSVVGDGVNAMEEFIGNTIVFQLRYHPDIKENQLVEYQGREYKIILLDRRIKDNTYLITLSKINE